MPVHTIAHLHRVHGANQRGVQLRSVSLSVAAAELNRRVAPPRGGAVRGREGRRRKHLGPRTEALRHLARERLTLEQRRAAIVRAITHQQNEIDQIDERLRQIDEVEGGCDERPQRSRPGAVIEPARGGAARRESACTGCAVRYTDTRGARGGTPTPGSTSPCACRRAASCETHATRATTASMSPACAATRSARAAPGRPTTARDMGGAAAPAPTASTSQGCGRERRLRHAALAAALLAALWGSPIASNLSSWKISHSAPGCAI